MKFLRAFTWYYRFAKRSVLRFEEWGAERFKTTEYASVFIQTGTAIYGMCIPAALGAAIYYFLALTGLIVLVIPPLSPDLLVEGRPTDIHHGAMISGFLTSCVAMACLIFGVICELPNALQPPNYQNKRHLWKDWPEEE